MIHNQILEVLEQYPESWKDKRLFRSLLCDFMPEEKLVRNLFCLSLDEDIPSEIKECNKITKQQKYIWANKMISGYGCNESIAKGIIETWIHAFSAGAEDLSYMSFFPDKIFREFSIIVENIRAEKNAPVDNVSAFIGKRCHMAIWRPDLSSKEVVLYIVAEEDSEQKIVTSAGELSWSNYMTEGWIKTKNYCMDFVLKGTKEHNVDGVSTRLYLLKCDEAEKLKEEDIVCRISEAGKVKYRKKSDERVRYKEKEFVDYWLQDKAGIRNSALYVGMASSEPKQVFRGGAPSYDSWDYIAVRPAIDVSGAEKEGMHRTTEGYYLYGSREGKPLQWVDISYATGRNTLLMHEAYEINCFDSFTNVYSCSEILLRLCEIEGEILLGDKIFPKEEPGISEKTYKIENVPDNLDADKLNKMAGYLLEISKDENKGFHRNREKTDRFIKMVDRILSE